MLFRRVTGGGRDPTSGQQEGVPRGQALISAPAHTADKSTWGAEWLLLSQGLSLVEPVPGLVPFICRPQQARLRTGPKRKPRPHGARTPRGRRPRRPLAGAGAQGPLLP